MKLLFTQISGRSGLIASEKLPSSMFVELINWELSENLQNLVKRKPYLQLLGNQYPVYGAIDWTDQDGTNGIVALKEQGGVKSFSYYGRNGATYDPPVSFANDDRTAGSTINEMHPRQVYNAIRSGAGLNASTDRPFIIYKLKDRKRIYDPISDVHGVNFTNGVYVDEQIYDGKLGHLLSPTSAYPSQISLAPGCQAYTETGGFAQSDVRAFKLYAAPLIDGYQRGFPDDSVNYYLNAYDPSYDRYAFRGHIQLSPFLAQRSRRITAIDIFLSITGEGLDLDYTPPYYFLTRVPFQGMPDRAFFKANCSIQNTYIEVPDYEAWYTWRYLYHFYAYNKTDEEWIRLSSTVNFSGSNARFSISSGVPTNIGTDKEVEFYLGWYNLGPYYYYEFFFDDFHFRLGSEMYDYLGIPKGDLGRTDTRYKYLVWNGKRSLIAGVNDDGLYYSTPFDPDVFPIRNRIRPKFEPVALETIREDYLIASKSNMERMQVYANDGDVRLDSVYSDRGVVSQKALLKVTDYMIFGCDYKGPWMLTPNGLEDLSTHVADFFDPRKGLLTQSQIDECVIGYNKHLDQIWFSFPTYTDSDYFPSGLILSYDLRARALGLPSPWFLVSTDKPIYNFVTNKIFHLLGLDRANSVTDIVDFNGSSGGEELRAKLEFMTLESPILNTQISWRMIRVRMETDGFYETDVYLDGDSSPTKSISLPDNGRMRVFRPSKTLRVVLEESIASDEAAEYSGMDIHGTPRVL